MTGVKPDDTCASSFEALKSKKESRYILYTITADGKHISKVASEAPAGTCEEDWAKFSGVLTGEYATKCCYAVFDFDWEAADGHAAQKIMFVLWSPEGAKVKDKMMTTGSKDALKRALVGIGQDFQATDASEITFEECLEKAKSAVRGLLLSRTNVLLALKPLSRNTDQLRPCHLCSPRPASRPTALLLAFGERGAGSSRAPQAPSSRYCRRRLARAQILLHEGLSDCQEDANVVMRGGWSIILNSVYSFRGGPPLLRMGCTSIRGSNSVSAGTFPPGMCTSPELRKRPPRNT